MGLPHGFQPRACPFCGSRSLHNFRHDDKKCRVTCLFCGGVGPANENQDLAWLSWNGEVVKAPTMFGSAQQGVLG